MTLQKPKTLQLGPGTQGPTSTEKNDFQFGFSPLKSSGANGVAGCGVWVQEVGLKAIASNYTNEMQSWKQVPGQWC